MKRILILLSIALLTACAQVGIPTPKTFNERLAMGYGTVTAVRDVATTLVVAGQLSGPDAQNVQAQADNARTALDLARVTFATNPISAENKLVTTLTLLTALQQYLLTKAPK